MENLTTITIKATSARNKSYLNKTFILTPVKGKTNRYTATIGKKEYIGSFSDYVYQGAPLTMQEASEKGKGFCFNLIATPNKGNVWFDNFEIVK